MDQEQSLDQPFLNHPSGMKKFLFKAQAVALKGAVRKPYFQELGEHAAIATHAGSQARLSSSSQGFLLRRRPAPVDRASASATPRADFAYRSATSKINAGEVNGVYRTEVTSEILGLSVLDGRLTVDRVFCSLVSQFDPREYPNRKVSRISPRGSTIQGLMVDHKPIQIQFPQAFGMNEDQEQAFFAGRYDEDPNYQYHPGFFVEPFHLDNFGTLYFAEWAWIHPDETDEQHLTMLRLALGSDFGSDSDCASGRTNGSGWPR